MAKCVAWPNTRRPRWRKSSRLRWLRPQPLGRVERRGHDILIAGATARIAGNRDPHRLFGRIRIVAQELDERRQNARRAEAALKLILFLHTLVLLTYVASRGSGLLDGGNIMQVRFHGEHT